MSRARLCWLAALLCLHAAAAHAWTAADEGACRATGVYRNATFGFSVQIPEGRTGCPNSPVAMSDHGVAIPLARGAARSIECYAGYNAVLYQSASDAAAAQLEAVTRDAAPHSVRVLRREATQLGALRAQRIVIRYRDKKSGAAWVADSTSALRRVGRRQPLPSHEYEVVLTTPAASYDVDRRTLEGVLATWQAIAAADQDGK